MTPARTTPLRIPTETSALAAAIVILLMATAAGCGHQASPTGGTPIANPSVAPFEGVVFSGQAPIAAASISVYAAGTTGPGTGALSLIAVPVLTGDDGHFRIADDLTCPSPMAQIYLVSRGGKLSLTQASNNQAAVLMAAIGNCADIKSSSVFKINEVTTAASVWALAQFLAPDAIVGASSTNAVGLANAFDVARNLVDINSGLAPGSSLPAGASLEAAKLYTLADILANCVHTDGNSNGCNQLFHAATVNGATPTNTLDAALNIVRNPGREVSAIFALCPKQGPFQPFLSAAPNDWTMTLTYLGGGLSSPTGLAVDSTGAIWAANYFGGVATKLSAAGLPAAPGGFADASLHESFGMAVDGLDNAWITNEESRNSVNGGAGSITKFDSSGNVVSAEGITSGGIYFPEAIAADVNQTIWIADYGRSGATLLAANGNSLSGESGFSTLELPFPVAVAVDGAHDAWFAAQGSAVRVTPSGTVSRFVCCESPAGIAVDQAGNIWVADYSASSLVELGPSGAFLERFTGVGGLYYPNGIAIDGMGAVWVTNFRGNSISVLGNAGPNALGDTPSPSWGYGLDALLSEPFGLAVDASGNVWVSNFGGKTITEFVGLGSPVRTPLLGPPAQP